VAAGRFNGRVSIRSSSPSRPVIEVALSGTGITAGGGGPRPAINRGGVVDAASFAATLAAGGIGSIFGLDLAPGVAAASATPLPTTLTGVRVLVGGRAAPLFFVSPNQINFQVPYEAGASGQVNVVVERNGVASSSEAAQLAANAPALFTNAATAEPIVQRHPSLDLITANNKARPGDVLILFLTGIGQLSNRPASGSPAPSGPLAMAVTAPTVTLGGAPATVLFAGLAPGYVGLGQINVQLPQFAAASGPSQSVDTLPLVVRFGDHSSRAVNLPVTGGASGGSDIAVTLNEVLPRQAEVQDNLVLRFTVRKPAGVGGTAIRRVFLSTNANVTTIDTLVSDVDIELGGAEEETLTASGVNLPETLAPRTYYIAVEVDFPSDANRANNLSASLPFEIVAQRPAFDASIKLTQVQPQQAGAGDSLTVNYTIAGADRLTATLQRSIYLSTDAVISASDILVSTRTVDIIDGSGDIVSRNNFIPREVAPGDYFVGILLESQGDRSPANNISDAIPVRVVANRIPFDIGVSVTDVTPRQVAAAGAVSVRYNVSNFSAAAGIFTREIRLSRDAVVSADDILVNSRTFTLFGDEPSLLSENSVIPAGTTPGNYFVGVIVETAGDTDSSNNASPAPIGITVTAPAAALRAKPVAPTGSENAGSDDPPRIQPSDN
jgi:uncharacterized protein (TIGR03437 family)